ncbi:hypothetical protein [Tenacibaculum ovolyticum]|uniref:hypothetical protein n=1 Tax=Tenacibaculum ovolyticum TaxID=104270 RepID=UPI003BA953E0
MKGLKIENDELSCFIEDAILTENDTFFKINGDFVNGYKVEKAKKIENIDENNETELYPSLKDSNNDFYAIAGETSWGGNGFVALKKIKTDSYKWVLQLSSMNNPKKITIKNNVILVRTDLNYPNGIDFIIPIDNPEKFKVVKPTANKELR